MPQWTKVCSLNQLKKDEVFPFDYKDAKILLANLNGKIYATGRICTHAEADLSTGTLRLFLADSDYKPLSTVALFSPVFVVAFEDIGFTISCFFHFKYGFELFICFNFEVSTSPFGFDKVAYPSTNLIGHFS